MSVGSTSYALDSRAVAWWWKVFFEPEDGDRYRNAEVEYMVREIYSQIGRVGKIRGNPPQFHQGLGKLAILDVARKFLPVPVTSSVFNAPLLDIQDAVVKSLSSTPFDNEKVLFTTRVRISDLNSVGNPWLAQQYIFAPHDVTTYVVGRRRFTFSRQRTEGKTTDWRKEQLEDAETSSWRFTPLTNEEESALDAFLIELNLTWGRIDFMRDHKGKLWFLEYNANGQFGFLDAHNKYELISTIAEYLEV